MDMDTDMDMEPIRILIADDEKIVREGLRYVIDWEALGFVICGEAATGTEALEKIAEEQPELVLLDIRMPGMYGTELMERARQQGYPGHFIVLSGYPNFQYAQSALRSGASFYLTKPIDEDELSSAVCQVRERILSRSDQESSLKHYRQKARGTILYDLLTKKENNPSINYQELGLLANVYQTVIYEGYQLNASPYSFAELLRVTNQDNRSFEHTTIDGQEVILLKGDFAMERFDSCLRHYELGTQKNSPLDTIFLAYGPRVDSPLRIHESYDACRALMERRFFCDENQHVLSYEMLPPHLKPGPSVISNELCQAYGKRLTDGIVSLNRTRLSETLGDLKKELYGCGDSISSIQYFLADLFLQIKHHVMKTYPDADIPFEHNGAILELIEGKRYLYEILLYFSEQFDMILRAIGTNSRESVFDDILHYIDHAYAEPLKLEAIAPLFGYNSSYLGKLFTQRMGISFNTYLDQLRVKKAAELLDGTDLKVYEVAARVGYRNVDYFHQKFKKIMGMSPAEYRKK